MPVLNDRVARAIFRDGVSDKVGYPGTVTTDV